MPPGRYSLRVGQEGAVSLLNEEQSLRPRHDRSVPRQFYAGAPDIIRVSDAEHVAYIIPYQERSILIQTRDGAVSLATTLLGRAIACDEDTLYVCRTVPRELLCIRKSELLSDHGAASVTEGVDVLLETLSRLSYVPTEAAGVDYVLQSEELEDISHSAQALQFSFPEADDVTPSLEAAAQLDEIATLLGDSKTELDALSQQLESAAQRMGTNLYNH